jgi:hypothetical protein
VLKKCGGLARSQTSAEIEFWSISVAENIVAHCRVFLGSHDDQAIAGVACGELTQQTTPIFLTPVFGLHLCARAAGKERLAGQIAESRQGKLPLQWCETKAPVGGDRPLRHHPMQQEFAPDAWLRIRTNL